MELIVEGLSCIRGGRRVFAEARFQIGAGEFVALTGPNGSGKSTLLRAIAGLLPIERGDVRLDAASLRDDRETFQEQIAYLGHLDGVKPSFSVRENLRSWARVAGDAPGPELEDRITDALARMHLSALDDAPAGICSAGQKRRLGITRLVLSPRPLWLLDEPTVALDKTANETLGALIEAHRKQGGVTLAATHAEIEAKPDREISMRAFAPVGEPEADPFLEDAGDREIWA